MSASNRKGSTHAADPRGEYSRENALDTGTPERKVPDVSYGRLSMSKMILQGLPRFCGSWEALDSTKRIPKAPLLFSHQANSMLRTVCFLIVCIPKQHFLGMLTITNA